MSFSLPGGGELVGALALAVASLVLSFALTWLVRAYAVRNEILDRPNSRSSHVVPTPRGGGAAVVAASGLCIAAGYAAGLVSGRHALALVGGTLALGALGWIDDRRGVPARLRLAVHVGVAVAALVVLGGLPMVRFGPWTMNLGLAGHAIAAIGIVWSINLFNFMDGIDGFAGSQAALIFGSVAAVSLLRGDTSLGVMGAILAAASAGFLAWNWPPAKIFLGDVGSGAIGFAIAALAVASENDQGVPLVAVAIIGGVFIGDATVTLLRRIRRGERLSEAHRSHAYQRLSRAWGGHRPVTLAAAGLTACLAIVACAGVADATLLIPALVVAGAIIAAAMLAIDRRAP